MADAWDIPWRPTADGVVVRVRVTPKSSKDAVEGIEGTPDGPALKLRVRAVPEDGAANQAVAETLARWLGVPKKSATLASGGKSRIKSIAITGSATVLEAALAEKVASLTANKGK